MKYPYPIQSNPIQTPVLKLFCRYYVVVLISGYPINPGAWAYHQESNHSGSPIRAHNPDSERSPPRTPLHLRLHSQNRSSSEGLCLDVHLHLHLHVYVYLHRSSQATDSHRNSHYRTVGDR